MKKIHLLLSGGGYRATLFHLGLLRFLYEHRMNDQPETANALQLVSLVAGVSGGSITACHLAANLQRYTASFGDAAGDLIDFCRETDLRRKVLIDKKSVPTVLEEKLFRESPLLEAVPDGLDLVVLGSSYRTGDCIVFRRTGISQWKFDSQEAILKQKHEAADAGIYLSKLIQASAAFPPFFPPLRVEPSLFSSQPSIETLGELFQDEVADGGVRDNLGYEWYRSAVAPDPNVALLISDAGQAFDWDATSRVAQGVAVWGQRLLRTTDIQMRRLGQLDVAAGSELYPDALYVGFADCRSLSASENPKLSLWSKTLPRGVGNATAKMSTDLTKIGAAQSYAIIRLGYDLATLKFGALTPSKNTLSESDTFWKSLFPESIVRRLSSNSENDQESLEFHVRKEEAPRVQGWVDLWKHVPLSRRETLLIKMVALGVVPFLWGLVSMGIALIRVLMWLFVKPKEFGYGDFLKMAKEMDWESTCSAVEDNYITVHGKLLERRESTIKVELDGLVKKIATIDIENEAEVKALPDKPDGESSDFLVARGKVVKGASDTYSFSIGSGQLLDTQRKRPATWDDAK